MLTLAGVRQPNSRRNRGLGAVLVLGVLARAILIPITHGQDFVVWNLASAASLHAINVYAHHPHYPGGPFAYFPLFLYVEMPFQWLAQHTPIPFTVLGKLPIAAADLACTLLIADLLRRRGFSDRVIAIGAALFALNPLVLYNSAYYGRFDTLGCALLLTALRVFERRGAERSTAAWVALAAAAKTFPLFVLPGMLRHAAGKKWSMVGVVLGGVALICAPYLATPRALYRDVVQHDVTKPPQALSWQYVLLRWMSLDRAKQVSYLLLIGFALIAVALARMNDLDAYVAITLVTFLLCGKLVLEQYLIWPMPWLILLLWGRPRPQAAAAAILLTAFSIAGTIDNETVHPFGRSALVISLPLAALCLAFAIVSVIADRAGPAARSVRSPS
jgi:hypothetical protein